MKFFGSICIGLLACGLRETGMEPLFAQEVEQSEVRVESAAFSMLRDTVIITFRLVASSDDTYQIHVHLRKGEDTTFSIVPKSLIGGGEVRGGGEKVILWDYKRDVPETFRYDDDYWFEISAVPVSCGFCPPWWVYALTAAAGGTAVAIISSGGGDDPGSATTGLPAPPIIRPDQ